MSEPLTSFNAWWETGWFYFPLIFLPFLFKVPHCIFMKEAWLDVATDYSWSIHNTNQRKSPLFSHQTESVYFCATFCVGWSVVGSDGLGSGTPAGSKPSSVGVHDSSQLVPLCKKLKPQPSPAMKVWLASSSLFLTDMSKFFLHRKCGKETLQTVQFP